MACKPVETSDYTRNTKNNLMEKVRSVICESFEKKRGRINMFKIIPLGGLGEIGLNMMVLKIKIRFLSLTQV